MEKVNVSKEQQVKDYNTVAKFLMSGNKKEVKEFAEQLNWEKFTADCCEFMDIKFIRKYKDFIDWRVYITETDDLSIDFLNEFVDYIDWEFYTIQKSLPIDVVREFADYIDWVIYTEDSCEFWDIEFIREFKDYIDWETYCQLELSEDFIREFADYVDWHIISLSQTLSNEFRAEFKEYLEEAE